MVVSRDLVAGKEARPPTSHVGWKLRRRWREMMMAQLACQEVDVSRRWQAFAIERALFTLKTCTSGNIPKSSHRQCTTLDGLDANHQWKRSPLATLVEHKHHNVCQRFFKTTNHHRRSTVRVHPICSEQRSSASNSGRMCKQGKVHRTAAGCLRRYSFHRHR